MAINLSDGLSAQIAIIVDHWLLNGQLIEMAYLRRSKAVQAKRSFFLSSAPSESEAYKEGHATTVDISGRAPSVSVRSRTSEGGADEKSPASDKRIKKRKASHSAAVASKAEITLIQVSAFRAKRIRKFCLAKNIVLPASLGRARLIERMVAAGFKYADLIEWSLQTPDVP